MSTGIFFKKYTTVDSCPKCKTSFLKKIRLGDIPEPLYPAGECPNCRSLLERIHESDQKTHFVLRFTNIKVESDGLKLMLVWIPTAIMILLAAMFVYKFADSAMYRQPISIAWRYPEEITLFGYGEPRLKALAQVAFIYYGIRLIVFSVERRSNLKHKRETEIRNERFNL